MKIPGKDPEVLTAIAVRTWKIGRILPFKRKGETLEFGPCFGGFEPQNRGETGSRLMIHYVEYNRFFCLIPPSYTS